MIHLCFKIEINVITKTRDEKKKYWKGQVSVQLRLPAVFKLASKMHSQGLLGNFHDGQATTQLMMPTIKKTFKTVSGGSNFVQNCNVEGVYFFVEDFFLLGVQFECTGKKIENF